MFFELLTKAQKIDYIKSVVLGDEKPDENVSDITYIKYQDEETGINTIFISFTTTNAIDDTENFVEVEVRDFCNDQVHADFMAEKLGLSYISAMNAYAKGTCDYEMMDVVEKCTRHYVESLDVSQTALSDFYDTDENDKQNNKSNTEYYQKTLDNYTHNMHNEQAEKS